MRVIVDNERVLQFRLGKQTLKRAQRKNPVGMNHIWRIFLEFFLQPQDEIDARDVGSRRKPQHFNSVALRGSLADAPMEGRTWRGQSGKVRRELVRSD